MTTVRPHSPGRGCPTRPERDGAAAKRSVATALCLCRVFVAWLLGAACKTAFCVSFFVGNAFVYFYLSVLSAYPVCLPVCLSVFQCVCLTVYLSACVSVCVCLPVCLSVCLSACLSVCVCPPVCLSVCLPYSSLPCSVCGPAFLSVQLGGSGSGSVWCVLAPDTVFCSAHHAWFRVAGQSQAEGGGGGQSQAEGGGGGQSQAEGGGGGQSQAESHARLVGRWLGVTWIISHPLLPTPLLAHCRRLACTTRSA